MKNKKNKLSKSNFNSVTLFAFNRPFHTFKTLESLTKNPEAIDTKIYIFVDGPRIYSEKKLIDSTIKVINKFSGKFKEFNLNISPINKGLASSIYSGINKVFEKEEATIILEDDIITSKYFLDFMNKSLEIYRAEKKIWHISGFNYPIKSNSVKEDSYLWRFMNCWGWATWRDRWESFMQNPLSIDPFYLIDIFDKKMIKDFNVSLMGENCWSQIIANSEGRLNTWAIFWYAHIFLNKGLCLNPIKTQILNIGLDGSGQNCGKYHQPNTNLNQSKRIINFPNNIEENKYVVKTIKQYMIKRKLSRALKKFI